MNAPATPAKSATVTTVRLKYPVVVDGVTYDKLTLRRAKARDQLHAQSTGGSDAQQEVMLFSSLAGVTPSVIEELDMADYVALQEALKGFLR